ncbi:MAG: galactokinase [Desulfobacterales bacterium]|jgi:galactokinase
MTLISQILGTYEAKFASGMAPRLFQAPGRVNLIGEHTDYNDGFVLPAAIDRQILVAAAPRTDAEINIYANDFKQWDRFFIQEDIEKLSGNLCGNYFRGMVWSLLRQGQDLCGMDAVVSGNVPIGAGLSSSAAIEVAVGYALLQLAGTDVNLKNLALAAQKAENEFVGMRCGIMDQYIACLGKADHALLIDCRDLSYQDVPLPSQASVVIVDSGVHRGLMDMAYNARREDCETAARYFGVSALRDVDMASFRRRSHHISALAKRRAQHVISENDRTLAAADALRTQNLARFGELMIASHASLRDDFEVSCPELDLLVDIALGVKGVYGARLTGAGFGGCMVALAETQAADQLIDTIERRYTEATGRQAAAYICRASAGVSELDIESRMDETYKS